MRLHDFHNAQDRSQQAPFARERLIRHLFYRAKYGLIPPMAQPDIPPAKQALMISKMSRNK